MTTLSLVADCGNGSIKVALVRDTAVVRTFILPSLIRQTHAYNFILGGFRYIGEDSGWVVGFDNEGRHDAVAVADDAQGKLRYLPQMLAGAVSALVSHLPTGATLDVYLLSLNVDKRSLMEEAVASLANVVVDDRELKLKPRLMNVLVEGYGCSTFATSAFESAEQIAVFDLGSGTANLSTYHVDIDRIPKRSRFTFRPSGIGVLTDYIAEELRAASTNGKVDRVLLKQALESNTYRLLTSFDGVCIRAEVDRAIATWLASAELKPLLNSVVFMLQQGVPVVACGGGWKLRAVQEAVELLVLANAPDSAPWLVPADSHLLGVLGLAHKLVREAEEAAERKALAAQGRVKKQNQTKIQSEG